MRMIWSPSNSWKHPTNTGACAPLIRCLNRWLRLLLERKWQVRKPYPHLYQVLAVNFVGREQNTHNTTREKRGRRRRSKSVQIWWLWTDLLQISDWRLKCAWICAKLGELILHLECFDLVSWELAEQSIRFDRGFVSSGHCSFSTEQFRYMICLVVKGCPIELKFFQ